MESYKEGGMYRGEKSDQDEGGKSNEEQLDGRGENQWSQTGGRKEGENGEVGELIRTEDKGGMTGGGDWHRRKGLGNMKTGERQKGDGEIQS